MWRVLASLEAEIVKAVPPIEPEACCWLQSDSGLSFCYTHAWERRWSEMPTFGPVPQIPKWFRRNDLEEILDDGIDSAFDEHSDVAECCEICGCTLSYLLTEHGQDNELDHFSSIAFDEKDSVNGDLVYQLTRAFMNLDNQWADQERVKIAINIAEKTLAAINRDTPPMHERKE